MSKLIKNRLRLVLKERKISMYQLARDLESSPSYVHRLANGQTMPKLNRATKISKLLRTPLSKIWPNVDRV